MDPEELHVTMHDLSADMFCQKVSRVLTTQDFSEHEIALAQTVLDPQVHDMEMSDFSETTTAADANGSRRVRENLDVKANAQVICE